MVPKIPSAPLPDRGQWGPTPSSRRPGLRRPPSPRRPLLLGPSPALFLRRGRQRQRPARPTRASRARGAGAHALGSLASLRPGEPHSRRPQRGTGAARTPAQTAPAPHRARGRPAAAEAGRAPARAPRAIEGTRDVLGPLPRRRPRRGASCAPPPPGPGEGAPTSARGRGRGPTPRRRRGGGGADSVGKKDTHPRQPRALTAPEIVTSPLPG